MGLRANCKLRHMCNDRRRNFIKSDKHRRRRRVLWRYRWNRRPYSTANQVQSDASFGGSETCTFYDADVGDEMRANVNAFSKLYDISMTKAKRQKAITDFFYIININYKVDINIWKVCCVLSESDSNKRRVVKTGPLFESPPRPLSKSGLQSLGRCGTHQETIGRRPEHMYTPSDTRLEWLGEGLLFMLDSNKHWRAKMQPLFESFPGPLLSRPLCQKW